MSLNKELATLAEIHIGRERVIPFFIFSSEDHSMVYAMVQEIPGIFQELQARALAEELSQNSYICLEHTEKGFLDNYSMGVIKKD